MRVAFVCVKIDQPDRLSEMGLLFALVPVTQFLENPQTAVSWRQAYQAANSEQMVIYTMPQPIQVNKVLQFFPNN